MVFFLYLSDFIIPVTILFIVVFACIKKVNIYDAFIEGAFDGLKTVVDILPTLIGLMVAVAVLRSSGFLSFLTDILKPFVQWTGFPVEIIPLSLMRLVSSSAATGLLVDLFTTYGTEFFILCLYTLLLLKLPKLVLHWLEQSLPILLVLLLPIMLHYYFLENKK